ncbi:MAG: BCCT family transporter [Clostridia bacterium]|jgi:BCCT family betaine/carnitine transporter|nr:BCCT family transporter [Clostridia bacterium]MCI2000232.1 BCCT family transporter [Clostridia bacterium]MCI2014603.1 BCCT family transporter [Clostridia bacterium]
MNNNSNHGLRDKFEIGLMVISILIVIALMAGLSMFPEQGKTFAANVMYVLTHTFGSTMQIITIIVLLFLVGLGFSKYGDIRFGHCKPEYRTISWVAMMFFSGLGAGTVYWAFLEWGYHFNAAPQLAGVHISEAYTYELSLAY